MQGTERVQSRRSPEHRLCLQAFEPPQLESEALNEGCTLERSLSGGAPLGERLRCPVWPPRCTAPSGSVARCGVALRCAAATSGF